MKPSIIQISTAALLTLGAASTPALAAPQWGRSYPPSYERRGTFERRAFDNGERDGYAKGIDDVRHHRYPDINRQKWYRHGDHNYDRQYGAKDTYRVDYRRGFQLGYDRAFRAAYREDWRR
jgi:hypothetical protein